MTLSARSTSVLIDLFALWNGSTPGTSKETLARGLASIR